MSGDMVAFLAARLDEDEAVIVRNCGDRGLALGWPDYATYTDSAEYSAACDYIAQFDPERELREVGAKRMILNSLTRRIGRLGAPWDETWFGEILRPMAAAYSDHPDYRREWAP